MKVSTETPSYKKNLERLKEQLKSMISEEDQEALAHYEQALQKTHPAALKLKKGDRAPDFVLTDTNGRKIRLSEELQKGKVVLTFYRGEWCPYCNLQLSLYQRELHSIRSFGANLMAVSPQHPDSSLSMKEKNDLQFTVLSDPGNHVARQYTTVFKYGQTPLAIIEALGYDFDSFYDDKSKEVPVPAVFIIDERQKVLWARSEGGDYKNRVEPSEILSVLRGERA